MLSGMPDPEPAANRAALLDVLAIDLDLDLTGGADGFTATSQIRFRCRQPGAASYADLITAGVWRAVLNGTVLAGPGLGAAGPLPSGRLNLPGLAAENLLVVESAQEYVTTGAGLRRCDGPDGTAVSYSKGFPDGARRSFCCFDQEDLRAPVTVSVTAPAGWSCRANAPVTARPPAGQAGRWQFAATPPLSPYLAAWCAGSWSGQELGGGRAAGPELPVTVLTGPDRAGRPAAAIAPELMRAPLRYYERELGAAYPFAQCDLVFVPEYPALAFGAPGLITIQDRVLDQAGNPLYLAAVLGHELAHSWFGGLIDLPFDDGWLIEALTTWISRRALEQTFPGIDPWQDEVSRQLPDHAYLPYADRIREVADRIGQAAVLGGLRELLSQHPYRCVSRDDLVRCWSRASGQDLRAWAGPVLGDEPELGPEPESAPENE
jgi:aminopeptidase N